MGFTVLRDTVRGGGDNAVHEVGLESEVGEEFY